VKGWLLAKSSTCSTDLWRSVRHQTHDERDRGVDALGVRATTFWNRRTTSSSGQREIARAEAVREEQVAPHDEEENRAEGQRVRPSPSRAFEKTLPRPTEENHIWSVQSTARLRSGQNPMRMMTKARPIQNLERIDQVVAPVAGYQSDYARDKPRSFFKQE